PSFGSMSDVLQRFISAARDLTARPEEAALRDEFVGAATDLATGIEQTLSGFQSIRDEVLQQAGDAADQVNTITKELAELNRSIVANSVSTSEPSELLDRRDQLLVDLAKLVDVRTGTLSNSPSSVIAAGGAILVADHASEIEVRTSDNELVVASGIAEAPPQGGQLCGLARSLQMLNAYKERFRDWATELVAAVDHIQATGIGAAGPLSTIVGQQSVDEVDIPLAETSWGAQLQTGDLYVTVSNRVTGERKVYGITIDPTVDSLRDVIGRLNTIPELSASLDEVTGRVHLSAVAGYGIDFSNRLASYPSPATLSGTSQPTLAGSYTGSENRQIIGEVISGGRVGLDSNVVVELRDDITGDVLATLNLGNGASVGQPVAVIDGVEITFSAGDLVAGDTFQFSPIAESDTVGILAATGLGTLFSSHVGEGLQVSPEILQDSRRLATGRSGGITDGTGISRLLTLSDSSSVSGSSANQLADLMADTGWNVTRLQRQQEAIQTQQDVLEARRSSISGVDPNEEMVRLLEFQRSFQAASRLIVSVNQTLDELFSLIR
ncbi:MAG: hypothetical protein KDA66_11605, partial [Planctomycetaceae bacterium]|nr:hypothetical protein [Planctomycetaceae bacterium]